MRNLFPLLALLILLASCQSSASSEQPDLTAAEAGITDTWSRYAAFWEAGDAAGCASLFTEDAVNREAPSVRLRGRDEFQAFAEEFFAGFRGQLIDRRTEEILVSGDLAVEFGFYDMQLISSSDTTTYENNQYVSVFKRQPDGAWLIHSWMNDND